MALLTDAEREDVVVKWETTNPDDNPIVRDDVRAAIDGTDQYLENTSNAQNNGIPQPARGAWSQRQKDLMTSLVQTARFDSTL